MIAPRGPGAGAAISTRGTSGRAAAIEPGAAAPASIGVTRAVSCAVTSVSRAGSTRQMPGSGTPVAYRKPPCGSRVAGAPGQRGTFVTRAGAGSTPAAPATVAAGDCASAAYANVAPAPTPARSGER